MRIGFFAAALPLLTWAWTATEAQLPPETKQVVVGPYNADFPVGGDGIVKLIAGYREDERLDQGDGWSLSGWIKPDRIVAAQAILGGVGRADGSDSRVLLLDGGVPAIAVGGTVVRAKAALRPGTWRFVAASAKDGMVRLFVGGREVARGRIPATRPVAVVTLAPRLLGQPVFSGRLAGFTFAARDEPPAPGPAPVDELVSFESGSPSWPLQLKQQYGELVPQRAWTLPRANAVPPRGVAKPVPNLPAIVAAGDGRYAVNGWRLAEGPTVSAEGPALSQVGFDARGWYAATVPGTVLTTLVDRGVYPNPTIGLNNMAIPEKLARQHYWYRTEFTAPPATAGQHVFLTFNGINYAAEVWLNGEPLGSVTGAFIRGRFDVTGKLIAGRPNAVAVKVSPPPHPGIPHEQSLSGGRGENGGVMMIDGPTFVASEGWDWMPGIRDRNTGLWQGVELDVAGPARLGDPHIVTTLPKADNSVAEVEIDVPVTNLSGSPIAATVRATFDDVDVGKTVQVAAGATVRVTLSPAEFARLAVARPRLWWPNGYGDPALHDARISVSVDGAVSEARTLRFGMRAVTYEMSMLDKSGALRRVEVDLAKAHALGQRIVDERHPALRKVANGWAPSFMPGAETSPAVRDVTSAPELSPHLVLKVNGVPIAARGGNIGMDDLMKRVERSRLEPFFRLHQEAHLNIIRNWVGQSTEEMFFDLADEYGLMVLNDFWESTQDYNAEAQDVPLFLANATDTVRRFRNHPSIVAWIGRNEGVPQPILNAGLQDVVAEEDGTRLYMGPSRYVNLAGSGPYNWREPAGYFTEYAKGFAVELGTPSFPTLESWRRAIPKADEWPINDSWAYHDWHQERGGSVKTFMEAMATRFGPGKSLEDFEKKAQMLEYESYRAIFEGFNAGLWKTNSARMLWMTQPAWPSAHWQIFSSDYDTHAAFYGTKKASEPIHVQMNLPDGRIVLVNNTLDRLADVTVAATLVTLDNRPLATRTATVTARPNAVTDVLELGAAAIGGAPVLVQLEARAPDGRVLSSNFYWQAGNAAALQALDAMPIVPLTLSAHARLDGVERETVIDLANSSATPVLEAKLTLFDALGKQVLPAYFSDNYVSLLPGAMRRITVRYPASQTATTVRLRGWNVAERAVPIAGNEE